MQKTNREKFRAPVQTAKNQLPLFLPRKIRVNPPKKHVNSIVTGKFVAFFFQGNFTSVKIF